ncbi:hypothetical protein TNCV_4309221 [Trichonephila clavipes]|nr:hypothetical protein TNCV_4309221 [Trichonephila clavipes]
MLMIRPRNCVPSKCFEGRLEMIECLNKSLPRSHTLCYHLMSVNNKYRMGPKVWPSLHVYELVINAVDDTPPSVTLLLVRGRKNSNRHCL